MHWNRLIPLCLLMVAMAGCDGGIGQSPKVERVSKGKDGSLQGWTPAGHIPNEFHQKNTGGSDGLGLCVSAATKAVMSTLGWGPEGDKLWAYVKQRPGGSYPEKWKQTAAAAIPEVPYVSVVSTDFEVQKRLSRAGLPWAGTMGRDPDVYGNQDVAHYVSWEHWDDRVAVYTDNNTPGVHTFLPPKEAEQRALAGTNGQFWITAIGRKAGAFVPSGDDSAITATILICAAIALMIPLGKEGENV